MCCIFTCCGWMIDLVQRLWTFTMSCCISSAVCCSFATAAMSGIALGYNYSLAEYIDLKETNVSVYIKRGVFDDDVGDDMDWRRSGHLPIAGHIGEKNLVTGSPDLDDALALRSGRRLDDSVFESNDKNKFEGSLMKLTANVPFGTTTTKEVTSDLELSNIIQKYPLGSIDQLKAIQSLIHMRKSGDARGPTAKDTPKSSTYGYDERYLPHFPAFPDPMAGNRRRMPPNVQYETPFPANPARNAVPDESIGESAKWAFPKLSPEQANKVEYGDYDRSFTYPPPVTPRAGPLRPPKTTIFRARPTATTLKKAVKTTHKKIDMDIPKSMDRGLEEFKEKLALGKYEAPEMKDEDFLKMRGPIKTEEDYEEDIKGLPVRRRRHVNPINSNKNEIDSPTAKSKLISNLETTSIHDKKIEEVNIETSTLINKILEISNKLEELTADTTTHSEPKDIVSKQAVENLISSLNTNTKEEMKLKDDIETNALINTISSKVEEVKTVMILKTSDSIDVTKLGVDKLNANFKTTTDQLNIKPIENEKSVLIDKILISLSKFEEVKDTTVIESDAMNADLKQEVYQLKSNFETTTDLQIVNPNDYEESSLIEKNLVTSTKFEPLTTSTIVKESEVINTVSKERVDDLNANNVSLTNGPINCQDDAETSTIISKILGIARKLAAMSADTITPDSETVTDTLRQESDINKNEILNDVILGKLPSIKSLILNLLQSTVS